MSTVVVINDMIVGESFAVHAVELIIKYPVSFSHSMVSQPVVGITGDLVNRDVTLVGTDADVFDVNIF